MFRTIGYTVVLVLAMSAPGVHAQTSKKQGKPAPATQPAASGVAGIGKGDSEFGVFGNYTNFDDTDFQLLIVGVSLGKYLSDSFQLRISPAITYLDGGGISSFTLAPVISGEFQFRGASRSNPVVPFVGGGIGISIGYSDFGASDSVDFSLGIGPTGGLKYFLSERNSLELAMTYLFGIGTSCGDVDCLDTQTNTLQQTLRFNFYY